MKRQKELQRQQRKEEKAEKKRLKKDADVDEQPETVDAAEDDEASANPG